MSVRREVVVSGGSLMLTFVSTFFVVLCDRIVLMEIARHRFGVIFWANLVAVFVNMTALILRWGR